MTASALEATGGLTAPWPAHARTEVPALLKTEPACALPAIVGLPAREVSILSTSVLLPATLFTQCHLLKACHISGLFEHTSNVMINYWWGWEGVTTVTSRQWPSGSGVGTLKREALSEESWTCASKSLITQVLITSGLDRCTDAVSMWGSHQPLHEEKCLLGLSIVCFLRHCFALAVSLYHTVPQQISWLIAGHFQGSNIVCIW